MARWEKKLNVKSDKSVLEALRSHFEESFHECSPIFSGFTGDSYIFVMPMHNIWGEYERSV
jgi:hypothetical protein